MVKNKMDITCCHKEEIIINGGGMYVCINMSEASFEAWVFIDFQNSREHIDFMWNIGTV